MSESIALQPRAALEDGDHQGARPDQNCAAKPVPVTIRKNKLIRAHRPQFSDKSWNRFCPFNRMPRIYATLGFVVGGHPFLFLLLGLLICGFLSTGLLWLNLHDNVRDGYTPAASRARQESNVMRAFMNSTTDPTSTVVLFRAKDNGSMHRLHYLKEAWDMSEFIRSNLSVPCLNGINCTFMDFCGSFCYSNYFIRSFYWGLEEQVLLYKASKPLNPSSNLTFPRGTSNSFKYQLEGNFFGVKLRETNDTRAAPVGVVPISNCSCESGELTEVKAVSYIDFVELIMVVYRVDFQSPNSEIKAKNWEMGMYNIMRQMNNSLIQMLVLGNEIVDHEMKEDGKQMAPYFGAGILLTVLFVLGSVIADSVVANVMDSGKWIMAGFVILCPTMALCSTFGLFGWMGWRVNSVSMIAPFLIMGIGVNSAFLILHSWYRTPIRNVSLPQRVGLIMEDVGPSITITTVTDVTTFLLGSLTPTTEIGIFCYITTVALFWCYVFTLLIFLPAMTYCTRLENEHVMHQSEPPKKKSRLFRVYNKVSAAYCNCLMQPSTGVIVIVAVMFSLAAAIVGFVRIDSRLDTEKILPYDCPIVEPHKLIAHRVWTDFYPVTVFVNNPVNLDDKKINNRTKEMVAEFEQMDKCKGSEYTHLWIRDYEEYTKEQDFFGDMLDFEDSDVTTTTVTPKTTYLPYFAKVDRFLNHMFYQHYKSFVKVDRSLPIPVRSFWFIVVYHNTTNWDQKISLMQELRGVADKFPDLNVTVWEVNGMFVDQMLTLKSLTYSNGAITVICMAVISVFFISHCFLILLAVLSIAAIAVEVIGFLSWWGLDLDPVTLCAFLVSVGMSVDFTAHIAYHLNLNDIIRVHHGQLYRHELHTKKQKVIATLEAVGWPTVQSGVSTVVCVLPLVLLQNYIPLVFVKTIFLVVSLGILHGLIVMPAVYALSWQCVGYVKQLLGRKHKSDDFDPDPANHSNGLGRALLPNKPVPSNNLMNAPDCHST